MRMLSVLRLLWIEQKMMARLLREDMIIQILLLIVPYRLNHIRSAQIREYATL
jgi:hypothetical protein